eukprot:tig00000863_g4980.t1
MNAFVAPAPLVAPSAKVAVQAQTCTLRRGAAVSAPAKRNISFASEQQFVASANKIGFFKAGAKLAAPTVVAPAVDTTVKAGYEWYQVLPSSALAPGEKTNVFVQFKSGEATGLDVLIVRDFNGSVYAVSNVCPHLGTPLNTGKVTADGAIVCSQHRSAWDLSTGEVKGEWCPFPPVLGKIFAAVSPSAPLLTYGCRETAAGIEVYCDLEAKDNFESKTYGSYFRGEA